MIPLLEPKDDFMMDIYDFNANSSISQNFTNPLTRTDLLCEESASQKPQYAETWVEILDYAHYQVIDLHYTISIMFDFSSCVCVSRVIL